MKAKALLVTALVVMMAFAFALPAEMDDAKVTSITIEGGNNLTVDKEKGTTLILNYSADTPVNCTITIYDQSDLNNPISEMTAHLIADDGTIEIPFDYVKNAPSVQLKMTFSNNVYEDIYFKVTYATSVWGNWTTYVVILVVVILVIALIVYKSRNAPKVKNQLTFEEIEAQKQSAKAEPQKQKAPAASSERQRYLASKKKKE